MEYIKKILYIADNNAREFYILIFLFLLSSALDLIGIGLAIPYISMISSSSSFADGVVYRFLYDLGFSFDFSSYLVTLGGILVLIFGLKAITYMVVNYHILQFGFSRLLKTRIQLIKYYQCMLYETYIERKSSEYIYNIQSLSNHFSTQILTSFLKIISESIVVLAIFLFLGYVNFLELLLLLSLSVIFVFIYVFLFKSKLVRYGQVMNKSSTKIIQGISESVDGIKEIRILGKESYFKNIITKNSGIYIDAAIKNQLISVIPRYAIEFILIVFIVLLVNSVVELNQNLDSVLESLVIFGVASIRLIPSITQIINSVNILHNGRDSVERLYVDIHDLRSNNTDVRHDDTFIDTPFNRLELRSISYKYPKTDRNILTKVSMKIAKGEAIGIVGKSGSGKTTIIDILLGFLNPQSGKVLYNDSNLFSSINDWRSKVAYITQELFLVDGSIGINIALSKDCIDYNLMNEALKKSQLKELVGRLPQGLDTELGERGIKLSGGQKQRIALARAFYHQKEVIIMDEATSALDNDTENEVMKEIERLKGEVTMVIIAHRISTVRHCDRIYELDHIHGIKEVEYSNLV